MNSSLASVVSTTHLNMKNMGKWSDMSVLIIPVLNSAFFYSDGKSVTDQGLFTEKLMNKYQDLYDIAFELNVD